MENKVNRSEFSCRFPGPPKPADFSMGDGTSSQQSYSLRSESMKSEYLGPESEDQAIEEELEEEEAFDDEDEDINSQNKKENDASATDKCCESVNLTEELLDEISELVIDDIPSDDDTLDLDEEEMEEEESEEYMEEEWDEEKLAEFSDDEPDVENANTSNNKERELKVDAIPILSKVPTLDSTDEDLFVTAPMKIEKREDWSWFTNCTII